MMKYVKRFHPYESTAVPCVNCFSIFQGDPTQGPRDSTDRLTNDPSDHKKFDLTHTSRQPQVTKSKRGYDRKETAFPNETRRLKSRMAEEDSMVEASSLVQSLSYMKSPFFNLTNLMRSEKAGTKVDPNLTNISTYSEPGLATNSIFFCFLFVKNSLICLEGKSMTPHRGNTILFRSSQQLPRLRL